MRRRISSAFARLLVLVAVAVPLTAHAILERVGPVDPQWGFPSFYQDTTGLMMDFCTPTTASELSGGWCLLLPPVPSVIPEVFPPPASNPDAFSLEHFYWAADAGPRALRFRMAIEGSFAGLTVVPGQQITFARIRAFFPSAPVSGDYKIYHPFGVIDYPGVVAGGKLFFTQDIGLGCALGAFDCTLATPIGPFLVPSAVAGGPELPPVSAAGFNFATNCTATAPLDGAGLPACDPDYPNPFTPDPGTGRKYLADPARSGHVTGSPLAPYSTPTSAGALLNPNRYRVEVTDPATGVTTLLFDTELFALQGRVFEQVVPGHVTVDRASYARDAAGTQNKLDVFATALQTSAARLPGSTLAPPVVPVVVYYDAPCAVDPVTGALGPPVDPLTGATLPSNPMFSVAGWKYVVGQSLPAVLPPGVCVEQTNAINVAGQQQPLFAQTPVTDQVFITESLFDPNLGTLSVKASSSDLFLPPLLTVAGYGDVCAAAPCANPSAVPGQMLASVAAPANKVTVTSSAGGLNQRQVSTTFITAVVSSVPLATPDTYAFDEDCSPTASNVACPTAQVFNVLANDTVAGGAIPAGAAVAITAAPLLGTAVVNLDGTISYLPNLNANGADSFQYTVTVAGLTSPAAAVAITINPINDTPVAVNDVVAVPFSTTVASSINVFANDTDPDGATDLATAINLTLTATPPGQTATLSATGGVVSFLPTAPGTYTFTYQAQDRGGGQVPLTPLTSNVATVTVTTPPETVTIGAAKYTISQRRWTVNGTYVPAAAGNRITVTLFNGTAAGTVIGSALTAANGTWTVDVKNSLIDPRTSGATQVAATGPGGARAVATFTLK